MGRGGRDLIEGLMSFKLDAPFSGQAAIQPRGVSSFMLCSALRRKTLRVTAAL